MWRPATKAVSGTNDVPLTNKRRFGLPEDAPPPPPPAAAGGGYGKPPQDMQFFNGLRRNEPAPPPPPQQSSLPPRDAYERERPRDDYDRPRDDYRRDDRGDRDRERDRYDRYDRGGDRDRYDRDRERDRERDMGRDRERTRERRWDDVKPEVKDEPAGDGEPRKRKSRWGDASQKVEVPGLPVTVMGNVTQRELDSYAVHVRLEEINRKLRTGDVIPPPGQRSPSPPPEYDNYGRRTNTLDVRYRKKLEDERTRLIDRAMKADPNFRPPVDMMYGRRNQRPQDKVYIPVKEFPEINFFGLLVGPRGNSLKRMERESGAKISIRGKGSVKEGKGRDGKFAEDEEDELHCLIMADDPQKVKDCVALINRVIETAASTPEGQNDHKRNQLRELASLNGTLRDDENQACQNCGEIGHRKFECPQQRVYSANVICRLCGGAGHMARDCRGRGDPNLAQNKATQFDSEYSALMAELGEGGGAGGQGPSAVPQGALNAPPPQQRIPPWRIPENWFSNFRPGPQAPHQGYGQQHQNQGYGYGAYQPGHDMGHGGPGGPGGPGAGGPGGPSGGQQDPYAAYYASMGQTA